MTAGVEWRADSDGGACLGGRYDVGSILGKGATAEVRSGWDRRLDRPVAIKLLRSELGGDPVVRRRFAEEARAAARLSHPNIVAVFDRSEPGDDGPPFIVMERLSGDTLRSALELGPLPAEEVRRVAVQMLSALQAGVSAGVLHCDVKPGNILAAGAGMWKLADFGIASSADADIDDTRADMVMGTPAYLAPERLCGQPATECSDLFALGVVLYEALTGVRPYQSTQAFPWSTALSGQPAEPVRSRRPDVDRTLAATVDRAIDLDPRRRFASAAAMTAALGGAVEVDTPTASRRSASPLTVGRALVGTAVGAAALAASLFLMAASGSPRPVRDGTGAASTVPPTVTTTSVPAMATSTSAPTTTAAQPAPAVATASPAPAQARGRDDARPGHRAPASTPARAQHARVAGHPGGKKH